MFVFFDNDKPVIFTCRQCGAQFSVSEYSEHGLCQQCGQNIPAEVKPDDSEAIRPEMR